MTISITESVKQAFVSHLSDMKLSKISAEAVHFVQETVLLRLLVVQLSSRTLLTRASVLSAVYVRLTVSSVLFVLYKEGLY